MLRLRSTAAVLTAMLFLVLALSACGGDDDDAGSPAPTATTPAASTPAAAATNTPAAATGSPVDASGAISVALAGIQYNPRRITARVGQAVTIRLQNNDGVPHTLTIQNGPSSGIIDGGAQGSVSIPAPTAAGTVNFFCQIHGQAMTGTIVYE